MKKKWMKIPYLILIIVLFTGFLFGCGQEGDALLPTSDEVFDLDSLWVRVTGVQVRPGETIEFSGEANLPEDNCLNTQLYADDELLSWWPVGKCFPVTGREWQFSVPLGLEGAPEALDADLGYRLEVYWPGAPERVTASFYFDVAPPPSP